MFLKIPHPLVGVSSSTTLIWEQAGLGRGEVGFVRHLQPFLPETVRRCLSEPLAWSLLPQGQWDGDFCDFARVMFDDHRQSHLGAAGWQFADPPQGAPAILAWLERRMLGLWQNKRARQASRIASARDEPRPTPAGVWTGGRWMPVGEATPRPRVGWVARARDSAALAEILARLLPQSDRYLVKVTGLIYSAGDLHRTIRPGPPARCAARAGGPARGAYERPKCGWREDRLGR